MQTFTRRNYISCKETLAERMGAILKALVENSDAKSDNDGNIDIETSFPALYCDKVTSLQKQQTIDHLQYIFDVLSKAPSDEGIAKLYEKWKASSTGIVTTSMVQQYISLALSGAISTAMFCGRFFEVNLDEEQRPDETQCPVLAKMLENICKEYEPLPLHGCLQVQDDKPVPFSYTIVDGDKVYMPKLVEDFTHQELMGTLDRCLKAVIQMADITAPVLKRINEHHLPNTFASRHVLGITEYFVCLSRFIIAICTPCFSKDDLKDIQVSSSDGKTSVSVTSVGGNVSLDTNPDDTPDNPPSDDNASNDNDSSSE